MVTRKLNASWIRSVFALIIGVLLVMYPGEASLYLVMTIGVLFLLPGLISLWSYFTMGDKRPRVFPLVGLGSALLGVWLLVMPGFFIQILMYMLGAMLVLAGVNLIAGLMQARRHAVVAVAFYIVPVLLLIAGLLVLVNPFGTAAVPFIILGVSSIAYALSDLINHYKFRQTRVEIIEEVTEDGRSSTEPLQLEEKDKSE